MPRPINDITGRTFGRLTVIAATGRDSRGAVLWRCACTCGNEALATSTALNRGGTRSCGCLKRERAVELGKSNAVERPGYMAAHNRIYAALGRAADNQCVSCSRPAREWAYDHADPNELTGLWNGYQVAYSVNPDHYRPMCTSCHRRYDLSHDDAAIIPTTAKAA